MTGRSASRLGGDLLSLGFLGACVSGLLGAYVHDSLSPAETRAVFADMVTTALVDPLAASGYATWGSHEIAYGVAERPSQLLQQALPVPRLPVPRSTARTALISGHGSHPLSLAIAAPSEAVATPTAASVEPVAPAATHPAATHPAAMHPAATHPAVAPIASAHPDAETAPAAVVKMAGVNAVIPPASSVAPIAGAHRGALVAPIAASVVATIQAASPPANTAVSPASGPSAPGPSVVTVSAVTSHEAIVLNPTPLAVAAFVAPQTAAPAAPPLIKISFAPANAIEEKAHSATEAATSAQNRGAQNRGATTRHLSYGLVAVRDGSSGVPRVFLPTVPSELGSIQDSDARKVIFLQTLLPLVLEVNEQIANDRARLEMILEHQKNGHAPSASDLRWMQAKADYYGLDTVQPSQLLARMDIVPPSLALAQAAVESGWGTSRLARKHNALFGQGKPDGSKHGPKDAAGHPVKAFPTLLAAVQSYVHNLNTHHAYTAFRATRAEMRRTGKTIAGNRLAATLTAYSELGGGYTGIIRSTIAANDLAGYDTAWLTTEPKFNQISDVIDR